MRKIQYNVVERETKNASGKAKKDVSVILEKNGFQKMYHPSHFQIIRVFQQFIGITLLRQKDVLIVQYPANMEFCYRYLGKLKNIKKIAIIHDMESLRGTKAAKKEASLLSMFDVLISHNPKMTAYLREIGLKNKIVNLNIFDYLMDGDYRTTELYDKNTVAFAGNLEKAAFLFQLPKIKGIHFNIYGAAVDQISKLNTCKNISYKGSFSSEKLIENLEGGWGLVWDGESLETCSGITGNYIRYNCPHKVSMCIVSERPIIIWSQAAMADYIVQKKLGIKVDHLSNLKEVMDGVTEDEYQEIIKNIRKEKERLVIGKSLETALKKVFDCIDRMQ